MVHRAPKQQVERPAPPQGGNLGRVLLSFVERMERLDEERRGISDDMKEVMSEAKGQGFDTAIIRKVLALRRLDQADRQEMESLLDLYWEAMEVAIKAQTFQATEEGA